MIREGRLDHVQQVQDLGAVHHPRVLDIDALEDPPKLGELGVRDLV